MIKATTWLHQQLLAWERDDRGGPHSTDGLLNAGPTVSTLKTIKNKNGFHHTESL